jgi:hypothetical protein
MIIEKPSDERHIDDAELSSMIQSKIALAEQASREGDFERAAQAFKEAAETSFELGDIEGAMRLLDRHEEVSKLREIAGSRVAKYIVALQVKVNQAIKAAKHDQARDLLKQMLAIAEQVRDIPAIKAIKQQLVFVMRLRGKK